MRSTFRILVAAAAVALALPQFAMAEDDIEQQLRLMDERMSQMEGQLQATQDELDASKVTVDRQQELIEKAGLEREAQSGLSKFLSETQFSGNVAASWNYNFNNPNDRSQTFPEDSEKGPPPNGTFSPAGSPKSPTVGGINAGALGLTAPFHSNHNTFQLDQFFLSMMKPATNESRGGWGVDLAWGSSADFQGIPFAEGSFDAGNTDLASGDLPHLFQAYVEYLAPLGPGLAISMGRKKTYIGAESFRADENLNITRGFVWAMQPVNHTGIWGDMEFENGLVFGLGGTNGYDNSMKDFDNEKSFIGKLGWQGEKFGAVVNGFYGGDINQHPLFGLVDSIQGGSVTSEGADSDSISLIDTVFSWTPSDRFTTWVNFDWYRADNSANPDVSSMRIYALAVAGRFGITERTGFALRYEFMYLEDHPFIFESDGVDDGGSGTQDANFWSITGTLDHALTDNLTVRAEVRYDWSGSQESPDNFFATSQVEADDDDYFTKRDQVLGVVQMLYSF
jgi:hypothetical protein